MSVSGLGVSIVGNAPRIIAQYAVAASHTGNTNETTLATITVPGGIMGPNGAIRITTYWSWNSTAGTKTVRHRFAGNAIGGNQGTTSRGAEFMRMVRNRGSVSSQIVRDAFNLGVVSSEVPSVLSVDTTVNQDITLTAQLGTGTDSITLEGYTVEVLPG